MSNTRIDLTRYLANSAVARWGGTLAEMSGFCITRASNSLKARRLEILSGLAVDVVLDIGANTGQWARELRASGYSGRIVSFEPSPAPFAQLQALARGEHKHDCVQAGLGSRDGEAELLTAKATVNSSFRNPVQTSRFVERHGVGRAVSVPIRRLDSVLPSMTADSDRFYMKIDTQGFEKEVLSGAAETLSRTDTVEIELSLVELYEGQALLPEVWLMLAKSGLRPAWIERGYRDDGDIWLLQVDGLFVREESWNTRRRQSIS